MSESTFTFNLKVDAFGLDILASCSNKIVMRKHPASLSSACINPGTTMHNHITRLVLDLHFLGSQRWKWSNTSVTVIV